MSEAPIVSLAPQFMARFAGLERAHGRYLVQQIRDSGKRVGAVETVQEPVTEAVWQRHLAGEQRLGIVPIRDDNTCVFGCIDWDVYPVDHAALVQKIADAFLPLTVTRSKSGGAHLWLFASEPVPAALMRRRLSDYRKVLNLQDAKEIFPKQDQLEEGGTGNWVNMPGFPDPEGETHGFDITGTPLTSFELLEQAAMLAKSGTWFATPLQVASAPKQEPALPRKAKKHKAYMDPLVTGNIENGLFSELGRFLAKNPECVGDLLGLKIEELLQSCDPVPQPDDLSRLRKQMRKYGSNFAKRSESQAHYTLDEMGNAARFIDQYGDLFRFNGDTGEWMMDTGIVWKNATHAARKAMGEVSSTLLTHERVLADKMLESEDSEEREIGEAWKKNINAWYRTSRSERSRTASLKIVADEASMRVENADLDADDYSLNCLNGVVDLHTGELREHRASDLCTKICKVSRNKDADQTRWLAWLNVTMGGDQELIDFLQQAAGYSLTGDTSGEKIFFNQGVGGTGKTTFIEAISRPMGTYADTTPADTLIEKRFAGIPVEMASMAGMRLIRADEFKDEVILDTAKLKSLTGGTPQQARFMRENPFTFVPKLKLWMSADSEPSMSAQDTGIWRRLVRTPFNNTIPTAKQDAEVKRLLLDPVRSGSAVLEWMIEGCLKWQRAGKLVVPARIQAETEKYRENSDELKEFLDEHCYVDSVATVPVPSLYDRYRRTAEFDGVKFIMTKQRFSKKMKLRGFPSEVEWLKQDEHDKKGQAIRVYRGLRLRKVDDISVELAAVAEHTESRLF